MFINSNERGSILPYDLLAYPLLFENEIPNKLLETGYEELDGLGRRFRMYLAKHVLVDPINFKFISSSSDRSIASGLAFYHGVRIYYFFRNVFIII